MQMDALDLFGELYPAIGSDNALDSPVTMLTPEEEFLNVLEAADADEDQQLGLSLLENHQDLFDFMAPMFADTFSPVPCDSFDPLYQPSVQQVHSSTDTDAFITGSNSHQSEISPLKQLLMTNSRNNAANERRSPAAPSTASPQRTSARTAGRTEISQDDCGTQTDLQSGPREIRLPSAESDTSNNGNNEPKGKAAPKALKFPPCCVCGGKASGLHYGVNSCEACKGFFRRYIIRNEEYKCPKDGNCKVVNKNRENCSGCRLQKCLKLGMSKQNCKLGRYSLSRRTETIKKVNVLEGKEKKDIKKQTYHVNINSFKFDHTYSESENGRTGPSLHDIVPEDCSPEGLIEQLVRAMDNIQPYGPNITTTEEIRNAMKYHHERYQTKLQTYGQMKAVPKEEYYKLLKEYGIDVDGRIKVFKEYVLKIKRISEKYYNFACQIPGFKKLQSRDQTSLLNVFRCDFFIILMNPGYIPEYGVILARNGVAYHIDELADRCFSRSLLCSICEAYARFQRLSLNKQEKSLLLALTLTFTDRCNLRDPGFVDKIQFLVTEVLRYHLERTLGPLANRRFAQFVDSLVFLREVSEKYIKEFRQLCEDEVIVKEVPMMTEFLIDEW